MQALTADDMERGLISTMIADTKTVGAVMESIAIDDFFSQQLKKVFFAIASLSSRGVQPDLPALLTELRNADFQEPGVFLSNLIDHPVVSSIPHAVGKIKEAAARRRLVELAGEVGKQAQYADIPEVLEYANSQLMSVLSATNPITIESIAGMAEPSVDRYEIVQSGKLAGVPTGLKDLDNVLGGFRPGDLVILAGRTSMGKTALATQAVLNAAKAGFKAVFFSLEMSKEQVFDRLISQATMVGLEKIRRGGMGDGDWTGVIRGIDGFSGLPINICDRATRMDEIARLSRWIHRRGDAEILYIDYLQLIRGVGKDRYHEVTEISRSLKALGMELGVPIVALAQLNRACDARNDKIPMLSDLRDSGSIEQDADAVLFLFRENYYNPEAAAGEAQIIVAKNRNGRTGRVRVNWHEETTSFRDLTRWQ